MKFDSRTKQYSLDFVVVGLMFDYIGIYFCGLGNKMHFLTVMHYILLNGSYKRNVLFIQP